MPWFTKQQRRRWRARRNQRRLHRLSTVETSPATNSTGRVISVVMKPTPDPQCGEKNSSDYLDYMKPWWTTVNRVGLRGTILHDGLPEDCIDKATTDRTGFELVDRSELPILHDRHRVVRDYLEQIDEQYVFVTDIADVAFKRDPFELIAQDEDAHRLFIGSERKTIRESRCIRTDVTDQFGSLLYAERRIVNPGILGGRRTEVIELMNRVLRCIEEFKERLLDSDMAIINKVVYDNYRASELFTGFPLHSTFRKWEYHTSAAIMHK